MASGNHELARRAAEDPRLTVIARIAQAVAVVLLGALALGAFGLSRDFTDFAARIEERVTAIQADIQRLDRRVERIEDRTSPRRP